MLVREATPVGANGDMRHNKTSGGFWAQLRAALREVVQAVRSLFEGLVSGLLGGRERYRPAAVPTRIEIA